MTLAPILPLTLTLLLVTLAAAPVRAQTAGTLAPDTLRLERRSWLGVVPGPPVLARGSVVLAGPVAPHVAASPRALGRARRYDRLRAPLTVASVTSSVLSLAVNADMAAEGRVLGRSGQAVAIGAIVSTGAALWLGGVRRRALRGAVAAYNADARR